jgi:hypothetical protein
MNRRHTCGDYPPPSRLRAARPDIAFTPISRRLPGESEDFPPRCADDEVGYATPFLRYSPRPGTPAAITD